MTEKEIIDLSMSVAKKIDATYLTKRKQIYFKKKGSKTSICFFRRSGTRIEYSGQMLIEGNIHFKRHTVIHEVCHVLAEAKYGVGTYHNTNFVREEMKAHEAFGYKTYYTTKEQGYIIALKELATGDFVYLKYNYELVDDKPVLKKKVRKDGAWREKEQRKYIATTIKEVRNTVAGAKIYNIKLSNDFGIFKKINVYYILDGKEEVFSLYDGNIKSVFKDLKDKVYEWNKKVLSTT